VQYTILCLDNKIKNGRKKPKYVKRGRGVPVVAKKTEDEDEEFSDDDNDDDSDDEFFPGMN